MYSSFCDNERILWQVCCFAILCGVWMERNDKIFRGMELSLDEVGGG